MQGEQQMQGETQMRAIEITQPGPPDVLQLCERAMPLPDAGHVLIKVRAAGINRPDVLQRTGNYPVPKGASDLPGLEVAGEIVGGDLAGSEFKIGDEVCALVQGGGYAEYCSAALSLCLPVPKGMSMLEAASLPETFFTVWSNVFDRAALAEGETLLVQGGSSGIGVTAIQLAKALGHKVFATAGSDEKCRACEALGADRAINYKTEDFVERVRTITGGQGVAVVLDMVGGEYVPRNLQCLAEDGRHVSIAVQGGLMATIPIFDIMRRRLTLTGSTLRPRDTAFKSLVADELARTVWPHVAEGRLKPVIDRTYTLDEAPAAHARMEAGDHVGKIVLTME
jgi:NADPH2:quinone reductase